MSTTNSTSSNPRRGASAAPVVLGVLAAGAVGLVAWRLVSTDPFEDVADPAATQPAVAELNGAAGEARPDAQAILDRMAAEQAALERENAENLTFATGIGESLEDSIAKLDQQALADLLDSGEINVSPEASERLKAGLVIPSHWYRVVDGKVIIGDPGSVSPPYAPTPAPYVAAVMLERPGLPERGVWRGKPVVDDLDRDGDLEIVASLRMWTGGDKGEGLHVWTPRDGTWAPVVGGLPRDLGYGGVDRADLDGDGKLDLAFAAHNGYPRAFLSGGLEGDGAWTDVSLGLESMGVCADVALGDWTGDGVPELAAVGLFSGTGGLYVFSYDRAQRAWFVLAELLDPNEFGYQVRSADIDGDGRDELLATTSAGVRVHTWRDGAFVDLSKGLGKPVVGGTLLQVLPRDLDGDGVCELMVLGLHNQNGLPMTLHKLVDGVWQPFGSGRLETESFRDAEYVELDGDPDPELFLLGLDGMLLAEVDAQGAVSVVARITEPMSLYHTEVADLDGDGLDEAVVVQIGGVLLVDLPATFARAKQSPN
jgi:hypothetical protein